jgi:hypothetical protein
MRERERPAELIRRAVGEEGNSEDGVWRWGKEKALIGVRKTWGKED